jgi:hypothetical protein
MSEILHPEAYGLQPVRIIRDELRVYEAVTFPKATTRWSGCERQLRILRATGGLKDDGSHCLLDVLNEDGDIVQDIRITLAAFNYLRRTWKFRRIRDEQYA